MPTPMPVAYYRLNIKHIVQLRTMDWLGLYTKNNDYKSRILDGACHAVVSRLVSKNVFAHIKRRPMCAAMSRAHVLIRCS